MRQLTIEPEFRDKIPPLSAEEYSRLEANILEDGEVREPIVVWGNTIIDGHNRYKIVQAHPEIPFKVKQMNFADKWDAIVWMCRTQLGRRNLTDEQRTYLIGKQYEAQKMTQGTNNQYVQAKSEKDKIGPFHSGATAEKISKEIGVPAPTVKKASFYARGLDAAEEVSPGIKEAVLTGEIKAPKLTVAAIRNIPKEERPAAVEAIKQGKIETAKSIIKPAKIENKEEEQKDDSDAYNADDFLGALMAAVNTFEFSLHQHMALVHRDMLMTKEGKAAAESALMKAKEVIKKYFRLIDGVVLEEDGNGKKD